MKTYISLKESEKAIQAITKARAKLILYSPFFASVAMHLTPIEDNEIDTMATDSKVLKYNSAFVNELGYIELKSVICHEVLHVSLLHTFRRNGRNFMKWNIACDYAVNLLIANEATLRLPHGCLLDSRYTGMSAEEIYAVLPQMDAKTASAPNGAMMPGGVEDYQADGQGVEAQEQQQKVKQMVQQAMNAARIQGNVSVQLERLITQSLEPTLPWQEILARFLTQSSNNDYSWRLPNSRYLYAGMYLPKLSSPTLGTIAVIIDTSGSIDEEQLNQFSAELQSILLSYPSTEIEVIYVDTKVVHTETIDVANLALHPMGGGGTDFRPGFKYIEDNCINPVAIIYFTDGECDRFPVNIETPTIWIINSKRKFTAPFGEVINQ